MNFRHYLFSLAVVALVATGCGTCKLSVKGEYFGVTSDALYFDQLFRSIGHCD